MAVFTVSIVTVFCAIICSVFRECPLVPNCAQCVPRSSMFYVAWARGDGPILLSFSVILLLGYRVYYVPYLCNLYFDECAAV